jgi:flagellar biosynthesis/type III secretory pathway chaperone
MPDAQRAQLARAFAATVEANVHGLQAMLELLTCERQAIVTRDPETLERIARDKLEMLTQIEHGAKARARLLQAAGLGDAEDGADRLVRQLGDPALTEAWQQLVMLGEQASVENARNGQLITQGQRMAREALGILTGRSNREDTYGGVRRRRTYHGASLGKT